MDFHSQQPAPAALKLPESRRGTLSVHPGGSPEPMTDRHRPVFLNPSTIDTWGQIIIYGGGGGVCPVHWRMLSIPDLCPLGTSITLLPAWQSNISPDIVKRSLGDESSQVENHRFRSMNIKALLPLIRPL